ncbi:MAG: hypothetical protein KJ629_01085, partial [Candidatus Omnitrophica bacterium]|nr:hypothetical protein [Candidatus Omnitrophota bacterium]
MENLQLTEGASSSIYIRHKPLIINYKLGIAASPLKGDKEEKIQEKGLIPFDGSIFTPNRGNLVRLIDLLFDPQPKLRNWAYTTLDLFPPKSLKGLITQTHFNQVIEWLGIDSFRSGRCLDLFIQCDSEFIKGQVSEELLRGIIKAMPKRKSLSFIYTIKCLGTIGPLACEEINEDVLIDLIKLRDSLFGHISYEGHIHDVSILIGQFASLNPKAVTKRVLKRPFKRLKKGQFDKGSLYDMPLVKVLVPLNPQISKKFITEPFLRKVLPWLINGEHKIIRSDASDCLNLLIPLAEPIIIENILKELKSFLNPEFNFRNYFLSQDIKVLESIKNYPQDGQALFERVFRNHIHLFTIEFFNDAISKNPGVYKKYINEDFLEAFDKLKKRWEGKKIFKIEYNICLCLIQTLKNYGIAASPVRNLSITSSPAMNSEECPLSLHKEVVKLARQDISSSPTQLAHSLELIADSQDDLLRTMSQELKAKDGSSPEGILVYAPRVPTYVPSRYSRIKFLRGDKVISVKESEEPLTEEERFYIKNTPPRQIHSDFDKYEYGLYGSELVVPHKEVTVSLPEEFIPQRPVLSDVIRKVGDVDNYWQRFLEEKGFEFYSEAIGPKRNILDELRRLREILNLNPESIGLPVNTLNWLEELMPPRGIAPSPLFVTLKAPTTDMLLHKENCNFKHIDEFIEDSEEVEIPRKFILELKAQGYLFRDLVRFLEAKSPTFKLFVIKHPFTRGKSGIPRYKGAYLSRDLIPAYDIPDEQNNRCIYITETRYKEMLKNFSLFAFILDHEFHEKGHSPHTEHKTVWKDRGWLDYFVDQDSGINVFLKGYIDSFAEEGDISGLDRFIASHPNDLEGLAYAYAQARREEVLRRGVVYLSNWSEYPTTRIRNTQVRVRSAKVNNAINLEINTDMFGNGEIYLYLAQPQYIEKKDCILFLSDYSSNNEILKLIFAVGMLEDFGAKTITVVLPYLSEDKEWIKEVLSQSANIKLVHQEEFLSCFDDAKEKKDLIPYGKDVSLKQTIPPPPAKLPFDVLLYTPINANFVNGLNLGAIKVLAINIGKKGEINLPTCLRKGECVLLVHSTDVKLELLHLFKILYALRKRGIIVSIYLPNFSYSRQHQIYPIENSGPQAMEGNSAKAIIKAISRFSANIYVNNVHFSKTLGEVDIINSFKRNGVPVNYEIENLTELAGLINITNLNLFDKLVSYLLEKKKLNKEKVIVIAADKGASLFAQEAAGKCEVGYGGHMRKERDPSKSAYLQTKMAAPPSDIRGKSVIVVDDIIDSGGTIIDAALRLKARGAEKVFVGTVYGIFSKGISIFKDSYVIDEKIDQHLKKHNEGLLFIINRLLKASSKYEGKFSIDRYIYKLLVRAIEFLFWRNQIRPSQKVSLIESPLIEKIISTDIIPKSTSRIYMREEVKEIVERISQYYLLPSPKAFSLYAKKEGGTEGSISPSLQSENMGSDLEMRKGSSPVGGQFFLSYSLKEVIKAAGEKMLMPWKGFSTSRSLSLVTIIFAFAAIAVSNTMLSLVSRQILTFIFGSMILDFFLTEYRQYLISSSFSPSLGLNKTSPSSLSISADKAIFTVPSLNNSYNFSFTALPIRARTNIFVSKMMFSLFILFFAYFLTNSIYFFISDFFSLNSFSHFINYSIQFFLPNIIFLEMLKEDISISRVHRFKKIFDGFYINRNFRHNDHLLFDDFDLTIAFFSLPVNEKRNEPNKPNDPTNPINLKNSINLYVSSPAKLVVRRSSFVARRSNHENGSSPVEINRGVVPTVLFCGDNFQVSPFFNFFNWDINTGGNFINNTQRSMKVGESFKKVELF